MIRSKKIAIASLTTVMILLSAMMQPVQAERIKDIASLQGVRENQLIGYGLVVGLDGTGDSTNQAVYTAQSFRNMLNKFGIRVPDNVNVQTDNVAAVMLSAQLPAFAKPGQKIDVTVSSVGNASSLRGGTLLMTSLKGADGRVYAVAQGNLIVSGLGAEGADGSKVTVNIPSAGRIPNGATVERPAPTPLVYSDKVVYNLYRSDFTTALRLADVVNTVIRSGIAHPIDAMSVEISLPTDPAQRVGYLSQIENLTLEPGDVAARIVVNSRTGTVVIGRHVRVKPAAVSHGSLTVTISETPYASQPQPFSLGTTAIVPDSNVQISEEDNRAFLFKPGPSLNEIVQAVNAVGASPSDLVAILESLKTAGALQADLEVI